MKILKYLFIIFLLFYENPVPSKDIPPNNFEAYINNIIKDNNIPGLSISVVEGDCTLFAKDFGIRKYGESDSVNEHTLTSSITKYSPCRRKTKIERKSINHIQRMQKTVPMMRELVAFRVCRQTKLRNKLEALGIRHVMLQQM